MTRRPPKTAGPREKAECTNAKQAGFAFGILQAALMTTHFQFPAEGRSRRLCAFGTTCQGFSAPCVFGRA
jgi:hypothetical protein